MKQKDSKFIVSKYFCCIVKVLQKVTIKTEEKSIKFYHFDESTIGNIV